LETDELVSEGRLIIMERMSRIQGRSRRHRKRQLKVKKFFQDCMNQSSKDSEEKSEDEEDRHGYTQSQEKDGLKKKNHECNPVKKLRHVQYACQKLRRDSKLKNIYTEAKTDSLRTKRRRRKRFKTKDLYVRPEMTYSSKSKTNK